MRNFTVLLEKELRENLRTKKLLVLACVFVSFAILSPMMARFMGEFFEFLLPAGEAEAFMAIFPDPEWHDAYTQFYSNMAQVGAIVTVILFMGLIHREKSSGTIDLLFCKGVTPVSFVLSKFTVAVSVTLLALLAAIFVNFGYTLYLFEEAGQIGYVLLGAAAYGIFLILVIAWVILASTIAKSTATAAVLGFVGYMLMLLLSSLPTVGRFLPGGLAGNNTALSMGYIYDDFAMQVGVAVVLAVLCLWLAVWRLKQQEW
ncbi:MAG: ABC transporter permease [Defluviitaleaceae bacterium]|nr:ABC transporter permease [Defluviitaleaceae bacterium]